VRLKGETLAAAIRQRAATIAPDDPQDLDALMALLRALYAAGRVDLPLGRLLEGHVDALQIVRRYGSTAQRRKAVDAAESGALFGVWNADLPGEGLRLEGLKLDGGKAFASGAGLLNFALATADTPGGRQLLLLDLERYRPDIDRSWWRTIGMQRSETHIVRWRDVPLEAEALIGPPGVYAREPWFSGGALRFAAVQAGGVAALFDQARDHLVQMKRADDPIQTARLADLFLCAQGAAEAVKTAALTWFESQDPEVRLAQVSAARTRVADAAERALALAQQAVGLQGLFDDHPMSATVTDLTVYLRQPAPDAQRQRVGRAAARSLLIPDL
jgi:alkylation response protein AidB-like acyl-CoA dehydrogenase